LDEKKFHEMQWKLFNDPSIYTHEIKMKKLIELQEDLIDIDIEKNGGKSEVCRMTGSRSQSYFIFDSQQYKVANKIYYSMEQYEKEI
jgi:hypothetical protein